MSQKILKPLQKTSAIFAAVTGGDVKAAIMNGLTVSAAYAQGGPGAAILTTASILRGKSASSATANLNQTDRLTSSVNPSAPRKLAFGETALPADIRYVA